VPQTSNRLSGCVLQKLSGPSGSLRGMADDEAILATVADPDGRQVVLLARIWEQKITRDHPELAGRLEQSWKPWRIPITLRPMRCRPERGSTGAMSARADGCRRS
jgi:hypothetical protein